MQLSYAPAKIEFSYCGEGNVPAHQMKSLLKRQLCLLCYDEAQTVEDLARALQCNKSYIIDAVKSLCDLGMMKKVGDVYEAFLTCFPMFNGTVNSEARKIAYEYAVENEIPKKINDLIKSIEPDIKALDFYGNDFELEYLNWFLYKITTDLLHKKLKNYYADKTDEVMLDNSFWTTNKRKFSLEAFYHYADEKEKSNFEGKYWPYFSTFYNKYGNYHICNVFDAKPFPYAWGEDGFDYDGGRNRYLCDENFELYMKLIQNPKSEIFEKPTDEVQKILDKMVEHGVAKKTGNIYKGLVPFFKHEVYLKLQNIISKEITPIAKEIAESIGSKVEELLLPTMKGVKERLDQFYLIWLGCFLDPLNMLIWYGMNEEGLKIPEDYSKSAAGIYVMEN